MTTKKDSSNTMVLDWVSDDLWGALLSQGIKMRKCIIKGGLGDWLCVLSVTIDGEYMVGFIGAPSLTVLLHKLLEEVRSDSVKWKDDQFSR